MRIHGVFLMGLALMGALTWSACSQADVQDDLDKITLPPGFEIHVVAEDLADARSMAMGDEGTLFVGTRRAGRIFALRDEDGDFRADKTYTIFDARRQKLPDGSTAMMPSGLAFKDGSLYVGALSHILRFDNIEANLENPPAPVIVTSEYPDEGHHGWKYIAFGPDDKLYVPVGAPCNDCVREEEIFASITRIRPDGTGREIIAHGVRNTVGFDWHPETGELWFTDNGVDMRGDNMPGDELNRLAEPEQHFGYPYILQGDTVDRVKGQGHDPADYTPPAQVLGPHVAALGVKFYTGTQFPPAYHNQLFIAEHGSWNRSEKIGYRITVVTLDGNTPTSYEVFAEGWLQGDSAWGRPVALLLLPDGSMLVSDDTARCIYRIHYTG